MLQVVDDGLQGVSGGYVLLRFLDKLMKADESMFYLIQLV